MKLKILLSGQRGWEELGPSGAGEGWGGPSRKGVVWVCMSWWGGSLGCGRPWWGTRTVLRALTRPTGRMPLGSPLGAFWASPPPPRPPAGSRGLSGQPRRGGRL